MLTNIYTTLLFAVTTKPMQFGVPNMSGNLLAGVMVPLLAAPSAEDHPFLGVLRHAAMAVYVKGFKVNWPQNQSA